MLFKETPHAGALSGAGVAAADVENMACGDRLRLTARVEAGVVAEAAFQVKGCTASIGCGEAVAAWMEGRSLEEIGRLTAADVEALVDGLPAASRHAAALAAEAARRLATSS